MDISTVSLLANQLQSLDTKGTATKDTLTQQANQILQKNADLPLELTSQSTPSTTPSSASEVMAHLLSSAVSEVSSKSAIYEVLKNNQLFKNMGNFSEDLKALSSSIKLDSNLTQPLALLQLFTKNIETIDTKMLQNQVQNSNSNLNEKIGTLIGEIGKILIIIFKLINQ